MRLLRFAAVIAILAGLGACASFQPVPGVDVAIPCSPNIVDMTYKF